MKIGLEPMRRNQIRLVKVGFFGLVSYVVRCAKDETAGSETVDHIPNPLRGEEIKDCHEVIGLGRYGPVIKVSHDAADGEIQVLCDGTE